MEMSLGFMIFAGFAVILIFVLAIACVLMSGHIKQLEADMREFAKTVTKR